MEKAEIKPLYTVDSTVKTILKVEKPSQMKQFVDDIKIDQVLTLTYDEKSDQIRAMFKQINWKKYPKSYFMDLRKIMKEIYETGRPYDF